MAPGEPKQVPPAVPNPSPSEDEEDDEVAGPLADLEEQEDDRGGGLPPRVWGLPVDQVHSLSQRVYSGSGRQTTDIARNQAQIFGHFSPTLDLDVPGDEAVFYTVTQVNRHKKVEKKDAGGSVETGENTRYVYDLKDGSRPGKEMVAVPTVIINGHILLYNTPKASFCLIPILKSADEAANQEDGNVQLPGWETQNVDFHADFYEAIQDGGASGDARFIWPQVQKVDESSKSGGCNMGKWTTTVDVHHFLNLATLNTIPPVWGQIVAADPKVLGPTFHNGEDLTGTPRFDMRALVAANRGRLPHPPGAQAAQWTCWPLWKAVWGVAAGQPENTDMAGHHAVPTALWLFSMLPTALIIDRKKVLSNRLQKDPVGIGLQAEPGEAVTPKVHLPFVGSFMLHQTLAWRCLCLVNTDHITNFILAMDPLLAPQRPCFERAWREFTDNAEAFAENETADVVITLGHELIRRGVEAVAGWNDKGGSYVTDRGGDNTGVQLELEENKAKLATALAALEAHKKNASRGPTPMASPSAPSTSMVPPIARVKKTARVISPARQPTPRPPTLTLLDQEEIDAVSMFVKDREMLELLVKEKANIAARRSKALSAPAGRAGNAETRSALVAALNEEAELVDQRAKPLVQRHQTSVLAPQVRALVGEMNFNPGARSGLVSEQPGERQNHSVKEMKAALNVSSTVKRAEQEQCLSTARQILRRNWTVTALQNLAQCITDAFSKCEDICLVEITRRMHIEMNSPNMDDILCRTIFVDAFANMEAIINEPLSYAAAQQQAEELFIDWSVRGIGAAVLKLRKLGDRAMADQGENPTYIYHEFPEGGGYVRDDPAANFFKAHILAHPTLESIISASDIRDIPWTLNGLHHEAVKRLYHLKGSQVERMTARRTHNKPFDLAPPSQFPQTQGGQEETPVWFRCQFEQSCPVHLRHYLQKPMPLWHDRKDCENMRKAALNMGFIRQEQGWDRPHGSFLGRMLAFDKARSNNQPHFPWVGLPSQKQTNPNSQEGGGNQQNGGNQQGGGNRGGRGGKRNGGRGGRGGGNQTGPHQAQQPQPYGGGEVKSAQSESVPPQEGQAHNPQPQQPGEGTYWTDGDFAAYNTAFPTHTQEPSVSRMNAQWPPQGHGGLSRPTQGYPYPPNSSYRIDGLVLSAATNKCSVPEYSESENEGEEGEEGEEEETEEEEAEEMPSRRARKEREEPAESPESPDSGNKEGSIPLSPSSTAAPASPASTGGNATLVIAHDEGGDETAPPPSLSVEDVDAEFETQYNAVRKEHERSFAESMDIDPIPEGDVSDDSCAVESGHSTPQPKNPLLLSRAEIKRRESKAAYDRQAAVMASRRPANPIPTAPNTRGPYPPLPEQVSLDESRDAELQELKDTLEQFQRREQEAFQHRDAGPIRHRGLPDRRTQPAPYNQHCANCFQAGHTKHQCPLDRERDPRPKRRQFGATGRGGQRNQSFNATPFGMEALATSLVNIVEEAETFPHPTGTNPAMAALDATQWTPSLPSVPAFGSRPIVRKSLSPPTNPIVEVGEIPDFTISALAAYGEGAQGGRTITLYRPRVQNIASPRDGGMSLNNYIGAANVALAAGKHQICPLIALVVGGIPIRAILDTGATSSCVGDVVRAQTRGKWPWARLAQPTMVTIADGGSVEVKETAVVIVHWNGETRRSRIIHLPGLKDAMLLGMETIRLFGGCTVLPDSFGNDEMTAVPSGPSDPPRVVKNLLPPAADASIDPANARRRAGGLPFQAEYTVSNDPFAISARLGMKSENVFRLEWSEGQYHPGTEFARLHEAAENLAKVAYRGADAHVLKYPAKRSRDILEPHRIASNAFQLYTTASVTLEPGLATPVLCRLPPGPPREFLVTNRSDPFLFYEVHEGVVTSAEGLEVFIYVRNETHVPQRLGQGHYVAVVTPCKTQEVESVTEGDFRRISIDDDDAEWGLCEPEKRSEKWKDPDEVINELDLQYLAESAISEARIRSILKRHKSVVMCSSGDLGLLKNGFHHIELTNNTPFVEPTRRLNPVRMEALKKIIETGLENGTFKPSNSAWASPIVLVKKKDNSLRLCIDYRQLNKRTKPDAYPLPRIDTILEACSGAEYFMVLDLGTAFWQLTMSDHAAEVAAFATPFGLFTPARMPMGPRNSPASFQRCMDAITSGLSGVQSYIDDLLIVASSRDELYQRFNALLERLAAYGAKIRTEKCKFGATKVQFLGFSLSRNGITPPSKHVDQIRSMPCPKTVKECQRFLGLCNFFRSLIKDFATMARPLTDALRGTRKGARIQVTEEVESAHRNLIDAITSYPVIAFPNHNKPFTLVTDASNAAIGVALLQRDDKGKFVPIGYMSKRLTPTQTRWDTTERELFAVVAGFEHFQSHLLGRTDTTVMTDHRPLKALDSLRTSKPKIWRWILYLEDFMPFRIEFKPGSENKVADYLSRCLRVTGKSAVVPADLVEGLPTIPLLFPAVLKRSQAEDEGCREVIKSLRKERPTTKVDQLRRSRYVLLGDVLCAKPTAADGPSARLRILLPAAVARQAVSEAHQSEPFGHVGAERLHRQLNQVVVAEGLKQLVGEVTKGCGACAAFRPSNHKYEDSKRSAVDAETPKLFSGWSIDLAEFPHGKSVKYVCVAVEWLTRMVEIIPLKDKTASSVAMALMTVIVPRYGCMETVITDQGSEFCNELVERIFVATGSVHLTTTPYTPSANGIVERKNKEIKKLLVILSRNDPYQWPSWIPLTQLILNVRPPLKGDGEHSPFRLLYGVAPVLPYPSELDEMIRIQEILQGNGRSPPSAVEAHRKWAHDQIAQINQSRNRRHNEAVKGEMWKKGDVVFTLAVTQDKMCRPATGPFLIWAVSQSGAQLHLLNAHSPEKTPAWTASSRCAKVGHIELEVSMTVGEWATRALALHGIKPVTVFDPPITVAPIATRAPAREHRSGKLYRCLTVRRQSRAQGAPMGPAQPHNLTGASTAFPAPYPLATSTPTPGFSTVRVPSGQPPPPPTLPPNPNQPSTSQNAPSLFYYHDPRP